MIHSYLRPHSFWQMTLARCPIPLAGLALAIASLGNALEGAVPLQGYARIALGIMALCILLWLTLSALCAPQRIHQALMHPVAGGIVPTYCMAWMVVSRSLHDGAPMLMSGLWLLAVILHLSALARFAYCRWATRCWQHMAPSWFIPPVGIIVASLSCPAPYYHALCLALLGFGMMNLALLMPLMLYRLIMHPPLDSTAQPTLAILAAPVSLALAGYLTSVTEPNMWFCGLLCGIALLMTALVYILLFSLLKFPFSPSFAAFTFPTVISATALQKMAQLPELGRLSSMLPAGIAIASSIELIIACALGSYVSFGFIKMGWCSVGRNPLFH